MKKRLFATLLVIAIMLSIVPTCFADISVAENTTTSSDEFVNCSLDEYIDSLNIDMENVVDVSIGTVQMFSSIDEYNNTESVSVETHITSEALDIPAVIVTKENDDGTITSSAHVSLTVADSGKLDSGIQLSASTRGTNQDTSLTVSKAGFSIIMEATYYQVKMTNYGQSGYAYAPSYSYFTISRKTASGTPTNCVFYTLLNGTYSVKNTDPTTRVKSFPQYRHSYSAGTPTLSYKYSFNDYSLYSNSSYEYGGYSGQLIHTPNGGNGSYFLKIEFSYGSNSYTLRYGIYNIGNLT